MAKVIIIGGGPSGMSAAITIKRRNPEHVVTIIEQNQRIGQKLLGTGNGRCNISNQQIAHGAGYFNAQISKLLARDYEEIINHLTSFGVALKNEDQLLYPQSNAAANVLDLLRNQLAINGVEVITAKQLVGISYINPQFLLHCADRTRMVADYLILATGGKDKTNHIYQSLETLGINTTELLPGLVPLQVDGSAISGLSGCRVKAEVSLIIDETVMAKEAGEVLFKTTTVSGIVINNLSSYYQHYRRTKQVGSAKLKLALGIDPDLIDLRNKMGLVKFDILSGLFGKMMSLLIFKKVGVKNLDIVAPLRKEEIKGIKQLLADFTIPISGTEDFTRAQVTIGGVALDQINLDTFATLKYPNLFIIGELLDGDGLCGGFNLHWCFHTGITAGKAVAKG